MLLLIKVKVDMKEKTQKPGSIVKPNAQVFFLNTILVISLILPERNHVTNKRNIKLSDSD